ncbi:hypothetical protein J4377_13510 [Halomonas sp. XH26]|uniref:hypothetical protein n=1 Tax=Halomonas sp. XH26 TaxID=2557993 RepID=UPI00209FF562|nr:hypothetical protein [Halomonas sp. XH26]UTA78970.1 hypothetical protein J4377_13510 [Halomonas sp. XH26]
MSLPQSVQAQVAAAAQHFDREPENPDADKAKAPEREQNPPRDAEKPDTDKPDTQSAEPPKDEPKAEPKTEAKDALYWEHRFNVIRGKYDTEVPALRKEVEQLKQQLADASKAPDAPKQSLPGVSDEELARYKEEYGDDLVSLMMRLSGSQQQQPNTEIAQRLERLESEKQEDAEARFWIGLEQAVPNYQQINSEPAFLQFLSTFNPQTGKQHQQALSQAQQSLDAKGVADVFKLYLNQAKPTQQQRQVPDEQVEPRTTKAAPTPQAQGGKLWTGADITQFYRDKTAGRYSADEAQRLEADIFAAQREGRVR